MAKLKPADPIARLSLVQRWRWKLRERQILEQFRREQDASFKLIQGKRLIGALAPEKDILLAAIEEGECWVIMRGVSDEARSAFLEISRYDCRVDAVGRYRDAWWISVRSEGLQVGPFVRVVVLAAHMTMSERAA